jgi:hypothetical protein
MSNTTVPHSPSRFSHQLVFGSGGDVEREALGFDTPLTEYGVEIEQHVRPVRLDCARSEEFVDDRQSADRCSHLTESQEGTSSEQETLFADAAPDQQTLDGQLAHLQFMFDE